MAKWTDVAGQQSCVGRSGLHPVCCRHDDDQRRQLGAAGLKGTDAVRVQAATKAAAEAGVRLALVTLKRRQVKTEVQAEQYEHPFDWNGKTVDTTSWY